MTHTIIDLRRAAGHNDDDAMRYVNDVARIDDVPVVLTTDARDERVTLVLRPSFTASARIVAVIAVEGWPEMAYGVETMYREHVTPDDYAAAIAAIG